MASVDVNSNNTIVTVTETGKEIVSINTPGPQGPQGPQGVPGPSGSSAATDISALNSFTGSAQTSIDALNIFTGSGIFSNITASGNISSSGTIKAFTGSFGRLEGLSPITFGNSVIFTQPITGSTFSGSFVGDVTAALPNGVLSSSAQISTDISGAFTSTSSSFSTRITANETITSKTLLSSSAQIASDISGAFASPFTSAGISGSFTPASASFSTRVTSLEEGGGGSFTSAGISGSLGPNAVLIRSLTASNISGSFNAASSSFSTRVTSLETGSGGSFTAAGISGSWQGQNFISASQVTPNLPSGTLSSSAQIASNISGSFNATSSSFSTRVTTNEANITSITSSLDANRVVFTTTGGQLATDAGMTYDSTNDRLTVQSLNVVHLTSSFITASTVQTSGSNIFGDEPSDTHTFVGDIIAQNNISSSGFISASHINLTGGGNSVITVPNNASGFTFTAAGGNSTVDIFGTDFTSNLVKVGTEGKFQINSYNTLLRRNYLQLYGTAYLTGTTAGYFTIAGSTGTSFNIGARLGVIGTTNTNAASALKIQNSDSVNILDIVNDKNIRMSGSLELTGSVDFTKAAAISGSIFSGSYVGDGSQLTGISSTPFPFSGDAQITGSLTVSGSGGVNIKGPFELSMTGSSGNVPFKIKTYSDSTSDNIIEIRDDGGTYDLFTFNNAGQLNLRNAASGIGGGFYIQDGGVSNTHAQLTIRNNTGFLSIKNNGGNNFRVDTKADNRSYLVGLTGNATMAIGKAAGGTAAPNEANTNTISIFNGTNPTSVQADGFAFFSNDVNSAAGTASPTFLTEDGTTIQLGSTSTLANVEVTGSLDVSGSITTFDINMSTWTLGADGGSNYYYFTGPGDLNGTEQNPDIHLTRGQKYRFYNPMNAHPFQIQDLGGSAFNTGVTNNGVSLGFLSFDVPMDGPTHLKYQCTAHAAMVGNIYISDARVASGSFSGSFQGDGNSLTNISSTSLNNISLGNSTIVGDGASSATSYGTVFGKSATSTGGQNVAVGAFSNVKAGGVSIGQSTAGGNYTVAIGRDVGNTNGEYNVLIGDRAGNNSSGDYNISLGYLAGYNQTSGTGNITIGSGSQGVAGESNQLRIGHGLHGALISGSLSDGGLKILGQVSASSYIGDGSNLTGISSTPFPFTGDAQITGSLIVSGSFEPRGKLGDLTNVAIGYNAANTTTGARNIAIGYEALEINYGNDNIAIGYRTMDHHYGSDDASENVVIGNYAADASNYSHVDQNVVIGYQAMINSTTRTVGNIVIGYQAISGTSYGGDKNIVIGYQAGHTLSNIASAGNERAHPGHNIIIGPSASVAFSGSVDQLVIASGSNVLISGSLSEGGLKILGQVSASSYIGDGSGLTGISSTPFPFTGDAQITGSLIVSGSTTIEIPSGSAFEILEGDKTVGQQSRLIFDYSNGDPTLTVASRASTAKMVLRQDSTNNGLYFDEDGQIYVNNSTSDGIRINGTTLAPIGTNANAFDLGSNTRPFKDLYLQLGGDIVYTTSNENMRLQHVNPNQLRISGSDGVAPSFNVLEGSITASYFKGDGSALTNVSATTASYVETSEYTTRWNVTNNGFSAYRFDGNGVGASDDNPDIYLTRGEKYLFNVNASGHPFEIRVANGGSAYSDGVTNNAAATGNVIFEVQMDAPTHLYYQCTNHAAMVGNIYIIDQTFPFTGSAAISGSLPIVGPITQTSGSVLFSMQGINTDVDQFKIVGRSGATWMRINTYDEHFTLGKGATVQSGFSTVIGNGAQSNDAVQTIIGYNSDGDSGADRGIAIGTATVKGQGGIAMGVGAQATAHSVILGRNIADSSSPINSVVFSTFGGNNVTYSTSNAFEWYNTHATAPNLRFLTGPTSQSFWSGSGGFFGFGTTTPDAPLTVEGSGSTVFNVIGSEGTLFSIDDDLDGTIFTANDRTGLPVLQAEADGEVYLGKTPQSLYTTAVVSATSASSTASLIALSTSSYDSAYFDFTCISASNSTVGSIMSTWNGETIAFNEHTTSSIGTTYRTAGLDLQVIISASQAQLVAITDSTSPNTWKIKTTVRAI